MNKLPQFRLQPCLVEAETLGSSGAYTVPEDLQVSAPTELWKKWYSRWSETRVPARRNRAVKTLVSDPATSVFTAALVEAETLGSSGAYTAPQDLQVSAPTELWTKGYNRWSETRVPTRRNRAVKTLVSDPATSVFTATLVEAETLGSSGAYTAPEDLQVSAPTELWKKWYSRWSETRVPTRRNRAVKTLVSDRATSVSTATLVEAETLGSSGAYTAPEDLQVSAPTELWKKWYSRSSEL
jgi:hypothetical protein